MVYRYGPPFTIEQKIILALIPKLTGLISGIFSIYMIYTIMFDKQRMKRTYHRIMLGISICDLPTSFFLGLSTWPIPNDTNVLWAVGNTTTCTIQGFFTQFGLICACYNASLSIYYLLVIRYGYKEHQMMMIEKFLHCIPILFAISASITGLIIGVYGNANLWCWVLPIYPKFRFIAFYGPLMLMILIVTINTILVYMHVHTIEKLTQKYRYDYYQQHQSQRDILPTDRSIRSLLSSTSNNNNHYRHRRWSSAPNHAAVSSSSSSIHSSLWNHDSSSSIRNSIQKSYLGNECGVGGSHIDGLRLASSELLNSTPQSNNAATLNNDNNNKSLFDIDNTVSNSNTNNVTSKNNDYSNNSSKSWRTKSKQNKQREIMMMMMKTKRTREVATQSFLYAGTFYITWFALTASRIIQQVNGRIYFPLLVCSVITVPIQSLPNLLVYLVPRFRRQWQQQKQQHHDENISPYCSYCCCCWKSLYRQSSSSQPAPQTKQSSNHKKRQSRTPSSTILKRSDHDDFMSNNHCYDDVIVSCDEQQELERDNETIIFESDYDNEEEEDKPLDAEDWDQIILDNESSQLNDDDKNIRHHGMNHITTKIQQQHIETIKEEEEEIQSNNPIVTTIHHPTKMIMRNNQISDIEVMQDVSTNHVFINSNDNNIEERKEEVGI